MLPIPLKTCTKCHRELPLTEFRFQNPGGRRHAECRQCHAEYERRRLRKKAAQADHRKFVGKLNGICRAEREAVEQLTIELLHEFDGVAGVVGRWLNAHDRSKPGSYTRLRSLLGAMRIFETVAEHQQTEQEQRRGELRTMTDEDLEAGLEFHLQGLIEEEPELAVRAAVRLGWTVIPPAETQATQFSASVHC